MLKLAMPLIALGFSGLPAHADATCPTHAYTVVFTGPSDDIRAERETSLQMIGKTPGAIYALSADGTSLLLELPADAPASESGLVEELNMLPGVGVSCEKIPPPIPTVPGGVTGSSRE